MEPTPIKLKLANIHCTDEGDSIGSAEPYLWTVFFKIDGDTVHVDNTLTLQGTATVVTTFGNHRDLIARDVDAGDNIPIPPAIGEFSTVVKPIPVNPVPGTTLAGVVGCIVVLLEQDETPNAAVAQGHVALNQAVQSALDELIPTLNFGHQSPTDDDIKKLTDKVGKKVEDAISDHVSFWDLLSGFGNEDDKIGTAVFFSSQNDICDAGLGGITLFEDWKNEGRWQISGTLTAVINELEVSGTHVEAHHIDHLGGLYNGRSWRLAKMDVIRYIQSGVHFFSKGADGTRALVEVLQHAKTRSNPTGLYLSTVPDRSKANNLSALPTF